MNPLAFLLTVAAELFMPVFFPLVNKEYSQSNFALVKDLTGQVSKWVLLINIPLLFIILLFPGIIINILFGQEYLEGIIALRFLCIGSFVFSLGIISQNLISISGKTKLLLINISLASIINFIL